MDLHLKYRPNSLEDFLGNKGVVTSLNNLLTTSPPHSYLFIGDSGCGKTTLSRIVALKLGCVSSSIFEINSADMRGIDFMREIIKNAKFPPMEGKAKAYILDEFHQVSNDAQNALLKILEDTPPHVYFMLCTTNPEKIIETIKNRCHKFSVSTLQNREIRRLVEGVIEAESLKIPDDIKELIVDNSDGVPRTALILLSTLSGIESFDDAVELIYKELYNTSGIADICKIIYERKMSWVLFMKEVEKMDIKDFDKTRIAMLSYFVGWIKKGAENSGNTIKLLTNLADICAVPFNYSTAKYEFYIMLSRLYWR